MFAGQLVEVGPAVADGLKFLLTVGDVPLLKKSSNFDAVGKAQFGIIWF